MESKKEEAKKEFKNKLKDVKPEDVKEVLKKKEEIEEKLKGPLGEFAEEVKLFLELLRDFLQGKYREVPWYTVAAITAALIYLLNPFDVIPDFIPIIGQIDDAAVLAFCLKLVESDIKKYKRWKEERKG
ncbi:YkvA family protein [Thermovibrio sp.]